MNREPPVGAPMHRSLTEPVLIMGMERKPALMLFIAAAALLSLGLQWYTLILAASLLLGGPLVLRKLAAYDAQFEAVIRRYASYQAVYEPEAPAGARPASFLWPEGLPGEKRPAVPGIREVG